MSNTRSKNSSVKSSAYEATPRSWLMAAAYIAVLLLNPIEAAEAQNGQKALLDPSLSGPFGSDLLPYAGFTTQFNDPNYSKLPIASSNLYAKDVTNADKVCTKKERGNGRGRKCKWNDPKGIEVTTFQKYIKPEDNFRLQEAFNLNFVAHNLGLIAPTAIHVVDRFRFYLATEGVPGFQMLTSCFPDASVTRQDLKKCVTDKLGVQAIAQWMVAGTFISDQQKLENLGFSDKGLALIDVDNSDLAKRPVTYMDFVTIALEMLRFTQATGAQALINACVPMDLNDIIEMKKIYEGMQKKNIAKLDKSVDMSDELYQQLLTTYIEGCTNTINEITDAVTASDDNNKLLATNIEKAAMRMMQPAVSSTAPVAKEAAPVVVTPAATSETPAQSTAEADTAAKTETASSETADKKEEHAEYHAMLTPGLHKGAHVLESNFGLLLKILIGINASALACVVALYEKPRNLVISTARNAFFCCRNKPAKNRLPQVKKDGYNPRAHYKV